MIIPTTGRVVLYWPSPNVDYTEPHDRTKPFPAMVAYVYDARRINVAGFDQQGQHFRDTHVPLLQDDDPKPADTAYAEWMPFQKDQAAKAWHDRPQAGTGAPS